MPHRAHRAASAPSLCLHVLSALLLLASLGRSSSQETSGLEASLPAPASEALAASTAAGEPQVRAFAPQEAGTGPSEMQNAAEPAPPVDPFPGDPAAPDPISFASLAPAPAPASEKGAAIPAAVPADSVPAINPQTGLPADLPPELVPTDLTFPDASELPSEATPGISEAPSLRSGPKEAISTLTNLLQPPPPGMPPHNLTSEQLAAIPSFAKWRQATATVTYNRAIGNLDGTQMNCGLGYLNDYYKDNFVGIPSALYRGGELCGACVRMACIDSVCPEALLRQRLFMITDSCRDCQGSNLVVSARGYNNLTGLNYDLNPTAVVAWQFASCAPLIEGGIKMLPSSENRVNYLGLNFSNSKQLLRGVAVNGLALKRTPFGYWVAEQEEPLPLKPPYELALLGVNGQRLTKRLASLRAQDLGVQF